MKSVLVVKLNVLKMRWRSRGILLKRLFIFLSLLSGLQGNKGFSQSICGPTVPSFNVNLTGNPGGTWTSSPPMSRGGLCCDAVAPDKCIEFVVTLDVNAIGINFQIASGAVPPGALYYQVDCGPMVAVGSPICLNGPGPYRITFCKPGSNVNTYSITSIPRPAVSPTTITSDGCNINIGASGLVESSVTWTSIAPGVTGQYNNYLACTTGCDTVKVTPLPGYPAFVDYKVCGTPLGGACSTGSSYCDTVRVYFVPPIANSITPNPASYCVNNPGVLLNAVINGGSQPYTFIWKNPSGIVVGTDSTYVATSPGSYVLEVRDATYPGCPSKLSTVNVTVDPMPSVNAGSDRTVCPGNPTVALNGSVTNATGGIWSGGAGMFSPSATSLNATYTPTPAEISAGIVVLTLSSTGMGACAPVTDQMTINITPPLTVNAVMPQIICYGQTANISAIVSGGTAPYQYSWSNGSTSSTIYNVAPGSYTVTVTDATTNSCSRSKTFVLNQNAPLSLSVPSNSIVTCDSSVYVSIAASGGSGNFSYLWNTGETTPGITVNSGTYIITATDSLGCSIKDTVVIQTAGSAINATVNEPSTLCYNSTTTLFANASGGFGGYIYGWNTGQTTQSITVSAGNYCVTVEDTVGCLYTRCVQVTQAPQLQVSIPVPATICYGASSTVTAYPSGGTPPYNYVWSTGETTPYITKPAGTYSVTVTDANSNACSATATVTIVQSTDLSLNFTTDPVSCYGGNNGSATVNVTGGTQPYNYAWSPYGGNSTTAYLLTAGTYTVNVYDSNGCNKSGVVVVTQPSMLNAGLTSVVNVQCAGNQNGSATVSATGGTPGYTYLWSPSGETNQTANSLAAGNNSVVVQDANGCAKTFNVNINEPPALVSAIGSSSNVSCNGGNDGTATVIASGGVSPYSYTWLETGDTSASSSNLSYGNYNISIQDGNGCFTTTMVSIQQPPPLTSSITSSSNITCYGASNGSATVTAGGGTPGYVYSWSNGGNTNSASNLQPGSYSVTVTDLEGCTATSSVLITQPAPLTFSQAEATDVTCAGSCDGSITVTAAGGTGPYQYLWTPGNYSTSTVLNQCAGTYSVRITDQNGCYKDTILTINEPMPLQVSTTVTGSNCSQPNGSATASVTGGTQPYTYSWSTTPVQTTASASSLTPGNFIILVKDLNNCQTTNTITIQNIPGVTASINSSGNVTCNSGCDGTALVSTSGGTAPFTYSWSTVPPQTGSTASGLCAGNYIVRVTGTDGCSDTSGITIAQPQPLVLSTVSVTPVSCYGATTGTATVAASGGSGSYNYTWNTIPAQTGSVATGLSAGNYIVSVSDANGCTDTLHIAITQPAAALQMSLTQSNVNCFGGNNGSASATVTGGTPGYTYSWNSIPSQNTPVAANLFAGTYSVNVTDSKGCSLTSSSVIITQPSSSMQANLTQTNIDCSGNNSGSASATVIGGTAPYTYSWSTTPSQTGPSAMNLSAGSYSVTISDAYGCSVTSSLIEITEPVAPLSVGLTITNVSCYGASTGSAEAIVSGGSSPYTYNWSTMPSQTTPVVTSLPAGTYTLIVTDNNGCSYTNNSVAIYQPSSPIQLSVSNTNVSCYGNYTATASATVSGGSPGYTFSWSTAPFQSTPMATSLSAGTYSVSVTDDKGCQVTSAPVIVTQPNGPLTAAIIPTNILCYGNSNGTIQANMTGGTTPYTYSWSTTPLQTGSTAIGLSAGTYSLSVTDSKGCTVSKADVVLSEPSAPVSVTIQKSHISCYGDSTGTAEASVSGGTSPYTYSWSTTPSQTSPLITSLAAGTYSLSITDQNGCAYTNNQIILTQPNAPVQMTVSNTNVNCYGNATAGATASVSGGTPGYTYSWSTIPYQATPTANGLAAGTYSVQVTDANNCSLTSIPVIITQPQSILAATVNANHINCFGNNTGSIQSTVTGGTAPYTYSWNTTPVQTGSQAQNLYAGNYALQVTDSKGCIASVSNISLTEPAASLSALITKQDVLCYGNFTGSAAVQVSGGTTPYTYSWSTNPVQTTPVADSLGAGTYSLSVTDQNGCTFTSTPVIISQPAQALASSFTITDVSCHGDNTGTATATASGGTTPYTYSWSTVPVQTTSTASSLTAGTYTLSISDGNGCGMQAQEFTISQPSAPLSVSTNKTDILCYGQNSGSATAVVSGGTAPYTYSWNTSPVQTSSGITNLASGYYTVNVTDNKGCTYTSSPIQISEPSSTLMATANSSNVSCFGGADGSASVTVTGGTTPYSYSWNSSPSQTASLASGLPAGTYFVKITDANGCVSNSNSVTITQPAEINSVISNTVAPGCASNNGSATVQVTGGTGPYFYSWNTNPSQTLATASNLTSGTYMAVITDMRGCKDSVSVTLSQPQTVNFVSAAAFPTTCNESCDGYAVVIAGGGVAPYSYSWSTGGSGPAVNDLCEGYYTIYVYDNLGCYADTVLHVTSPAPVLLSSTVTPSNCYQNNGSASVTPSGGMAAYSYSWSSNPPSYGPTLNGVVPGNYSVTVTDARGCQSSLVVTVPNLPGVQLTGSTVVNALCKDSCDGTAMVTASSGSAPYTYFWNTTPPQFSANANGLCAGSYKATVRDDDGCWDTLSVVISEPDYINIVSSDTPTICIGQSATLSATSEGGNGVYTYNWNYGISYDQTYTVSPVVTTNYSLLVTDSNGCRSQILSIPVNVHAPLSVVSITGDSICPGEVGTVSSMVSGGDGNYSYVWMPGNITTPTFEASPGETTNYTLTIQDGCGSPSATDSTKLIIHGVPEIAFTPDMRSGCKPLCVSFTNNSSVSSGTIASWNWSFTNGNQTTDQSPIVCFNEEGTSGLKVEAVSSYGCKTTVNLDNYIEVHPDPQADFVLGPQPADILNPLITFTDNSTGAVQWEWSFNDSQDGRFSTEQHPTYAYSDTGNFCPVLKVSNQYGCVSEKEECLYIQPEFAFYIPNAFSPNGDGYNETFSGIGTLVNEFEMMIFDRWGNLIYQTNDIEKPWNGRANDGSYIAQEDVYVYKIRVWDQTRKIHEYRGSVTLVK